MFKKELLQQQNSNQNNLIKTTEILQTTIVFSLNLIQKKQNILDAMNKESKTNEIEQYQNFIKTQIENAKNFINLVMKIYKNIEENDKNQQIKKNELIEKQTEKNSLQKKIDIYKTLENQYKNLKEQRQNLETKQNGDNAKNIQQINDIEQKIKQRANILTKIQHKNHIYKYNIYQKQIENITLNFTNIKNINKDFSDLFIELLQYAITNKNIEMLKSIKNNILQMFIEKVNMLKNDNYHILNKTYIHSSKFNINMYRLEGLSAMFDELFIKESKKEECCEFLIKFKKNQSHLYHDKFYMIINNLETNYNNINTFFDIIINDLTIDINKNILYKIINFANMLFCFISQCKTTTLQEDDDNFDKFKITQHISRPCPASELFTNYIYKIMEICIEDFILNIQSISKETRIKIKKQLKSIINENKNHKVKYKSKYLLKNLQNIIISVCERLDEFNNNRENPYTDKNIMQMAIILNITENIQTKINQFNSLVKTFIENNEEDMDNMIKSIKPYAEKHNQNFYNTNLMMY